VKLNAPYATPDPTPERITRPRQREPKLCGCSSSPLRIAYPDHALTCPRALPKMLAEERQRERLCTRGKEHPWHASRQKTSSLDYGRDSNNGSAHLHNLSAAARAREVRTGPRPPAAAGLLRMIRQLTDGLFSMLLGEAAPGTRSCFKTSALKGRSIPVPQPRDQRPGAARPTPFPNQP
jgi:hypothetical protein